MLSKLIKKKKNLSPFFEPSSIAVIGASNDTSKIGGYIFSQIKDLKEIKAYPINVKWKTIQEVPAYTNVVDIKQEIDLAIIIIPSNYVISALEDCAKANIKQVIIISAGFKEVGEEGEVKEEALKDIAKKHNIQILGPNCLGLLNAHKKLNCSFAKDLPKPGSIALMSQSGAVIDAIIDWSLNKHLGFSKITSLGNMAGINECDLLRYYKDDPHTKTIVCYMETLERGEEFAQIVKEIGKSKAVIVIKPGKSQNAQAAIGSHTGSLAQDSKLVETLLKDANAILVENLNELFNVLQATNAHPPNRKETVILTNAGGPGVISTDMLDSKSEFTLYKLKEQEKQEFSFLPKEGSLNNPIDILGDAKSERYLPTLQKLCQNKTIGNILILLTPQIMTDSLEIAKGIVEIHKTTKKTIACCFLGGKQVETAISYLQQHNVAHFTSPVEAITALEHLFTFNTKQLSNEQKKYNIKTIETQSIKEELSKKEGLLSYEDSKKLLESLAISMPHKEIMRNFDDIIQCPIEINKTYVLKGDGPKLLHKKELGAVKTNITLENFEEESCAMLTRLQSEDEQSYLTLEEQVSGVEVFLGLKKSPELGNFLMVGWGGTYVNVLQDIAIGSCPLSHTQAEELINSTKVSTLLKGYRGDKAVKMNQLIELLVRMSYLQKIYPEIKEVDLNPVICNEHGIYLVDVKLITKKA